MPLDARLSTTLLAEPWWPIVEAQTLAAYCSLLLYAVGRETDGWVPGEYALGDFRLPHVTDEALDQLEKVGLLRYDGPDVVLDWEHQTKHAELEEKRKAARERQKRFRDKQKIHPEGSSEGDAHVTRYEQVSHACVGKDKDRQGQARRNG